jgi:HRDC domain
LTEVARRRPASLPALEAIPGIGRNKLERYGSAVIGIVTASSGDRQQHSAGIDGPGSENASAEKDVPV